MANRFTEAIQAGKNSNDLHNDTNYCSQNSDSESLFGGALIRSFENILDMLRNLGLLSDSNAVAVESLGSLNSWEFAFKLSLENLSSHQLEELLLETFTSAVSYETDVCCLLELFLP